MKDRQCGTRHTLRGRVEQIHRHNFIVYFERFPVQDLRLDAPQLRFERNFQKGSRGSVPVRVHARVLRVGRPDRNEGRSLGKQLRFGSLAILHSPAASDCHVLLQKVHNINEGFRLVFVV